MITKKQALEYAEKLEEFIDYERDTSQGACCELCIFGFTCNGYDGCIGDDTQYYINLIVNNLKGAQ